MKYRGICIAGGGGGGGVTDTALKGRRNSTYNTNYSYGNIETYKKFFDKGFNLFRISFLRERLEPKLDDYLEPKELARINNLVTSLTSKGATVLLDPHDGALYQTTDDPKDLYKAGSEQFTIEQYVNFYRKLATLYSANPLVIFGLSNEPTHHTALEWYQIAQATINAIRSTGSKNPIAIQGIKWSGGHNWFSSDGTSSNADMFPTLKDSENNLIIEVHQYLDNDSSGTLDVIKDNNINIGAECLKHFTEWCSKQGYKAILGEIGVGKSEVALDALNETLAYMEANSNVWLGYSYFCSAPWFSNLFYNIYPYDEEKFPQLKVMNKYGNQPVKETPIEPIEETNTQEIVLPNNIKNISLDITKEGIKLKLEFNKE